MKYIHANFHVLIYNGSIVTDVRLKAKCNFTYPLFCSFTFYIKIMANKVVFGNLIAILKFWRNILSSSSGSDLQPG
jgi:hypothetical protein